MFVYLSVRRGEATFIADMEKVSMGYASNVLILNPEDMGQVTFKAQCVAASVMQERCQPRKSRGFGHDELHTVVVQSAPSDLPGEGCSETKYEKVVKMDTNCSQLETTRQRCSASPRSSGARWSTALSPVPSGLSFLSRLRC